MSKMDKLSMSLEEIIKLEQQGQSGSSVIPRNQKKNIINNSEAMSCPDSQKDQKWLQRMPKMNQASNWNNYNYTNRGNYIGNRINQWPSGRNWGGHYNQNQNIRGTSQLKRMPNKATVSQQVARNRLRQAARFLNYKQQGNSFTVCPQNAQFGNRQNFWQPSRNNSYLTKDVLSRFNRINQATNKGLRRTGSFSNLQMSVYNGRKNFKRAGSVGSVCSAYSHFSNRSNRSWRSNYSNRSRKSNKSNFSGCSNYSNQSKKSIQSNHSNSNSVKSNYSNKSGSSDYSGKQGRANFPNKSNGHTLPRFRFYLNWKIQKEIKFIQVEGRRVQCNSPMGMNVGNVESLCPLVFSTGTKINDRFTSNNAE